MSWVGYLVLGLVALMTAYVLWTGLASHYIKGRAVDHLDSILPGIAKHRDKAVIYCYSEHCGPCRRMSPAIDQLGQHYSNLFKLDVARHPVEARTLGIRATPTTLLVEEGKIIKVLLGGGALPAVRVFLGN